MDSSAILLELLKTMHQLSFAKLSFYLESNERPQILDFITLLYDPTWSRNILIYSERRFGWRGKTHRILLIVYSLF